MKELPLLSSDIALFDWDVSNGNATAEQTQTAYNALISQGQTAAFSQLVWNDLVDKLYNALTESGLSWNNYCGSAEDTKIDVQYGELTANRFNAVRYNIDSLINTNWKWSFDNNLKGYLGRQEVRGYSQYGLNGDFVYGWYIVELARVLNVFLNILKNEADFSEFVHQKSIETLLHAPLYAGLSAPFTYQKSILTTQNVDFYAGIAALLNSNSRILSGENAGVELVPTRPLYIRVGSKSLGHSEIQPKLSGTLIHRQSSTTSVSATLKDAIYVGRMVHRQSSKTQYNAELLFTDVAEMLIRSVANSIEHAALQKNLSAFMDASAILKSIGFATMTRRSPMLLQGFTLSETKENSVLGIVTPFYLITNEKSFSYHDATTRVFRSARFYSMVENSFSRFLAEAVEFPATYFVSSERLFSKRFAELPVLEAKRMESGTIIQSRERVDYVPIIPFYMESKESAKSSEKADVISAMPKLAEAGEIIFSQNLSELISREPIKAEVKEIARSSKVANFVRRSVRKADVLEVIKSNVKAVLSFYSEEPEDGWYDPVQTGNSIYIRSIHPQWQDGNVVHVDSGGVFYDAEQTEISVYIRSVDGMKGVM